MNSEKQNFERLLTRVVKGDELTTGGDLPVLQGAVKLFQYLKETISRCATMSTGETLVSMVTWVRVACVRRSVVTCVACGHGSAKHLVFSGGWD